MINGQEVAIYFCRGKGCWNLSETMTLEDSNHIVTLEERRLRPDLLFIGTERLRCECGELNTWFGMIEGAR